MPQFKRLKHLLTKAQTILIVLNIIISGLIIFLFFGGFPLLNRPLKKWVSQIGIFLDSNPITANLARIYFELISNRLILSIILLSLALLFLWCALNRPKRLLVNILEIIGFFHYTTAPGLALVCYNKAIEICPKQSLWKNRGVMLFYLGRYEEAICSFNQAIKCELFSEAKSSFSIDDDQFWTYRGEALAILKHYDEAIDSYDQALKLQPDCSRTLLLRVLALVQVKRHSEAVQTCDKLLRFQPKNAQVLLLKGASLTNLKRYEEALLTYEQALKFQPDNSEIWYYRAVLMSRLQRYEEALFSCQRALKFDPVHRSDKYKHKYLLIELLNSLNNTLKISQNLEKHFPDLTINLQRFGESFSSSWEPTLKFNPNYRLAKCQKGFILIELNRLEEALNFSHQLEQQFPSDPLPLNVKGIALSHLGRAAEAITTFNQAIQLQPDDANSWYNKGCHYAENGQVAEAISSLKRALELNSDFADSLGTDKSFDYIRDHEEFQHLLKN